MFSFLLLFLALGKTFCPQTPYPVVFVHGTGDSSVAWKLTGPAVSRHLEKYYRTPGHPFFSSGGGISKDRFDKDSSDNIRNSCVYVVFSDHFASPDKLAIELKKAVDDTREETWLNFKNYYKSKDEVKVNLVCHSMGGLVARQYLVENFKNHHVSKLILMGVPNKGSSVLMFNWVPVTFMAGGIAGFVFSGNPLALSFSLIGIGVNAVSSARGVKLLSPATEAMKPGSKFLTGLNSREMPADVEYAVILCSADDFMHSMSNKVLGYENGDGAISINSQSLRYGAVPNFDELKYKEDKIIAPHFEEPSLAKNVILEILDFED